MNNCIITPKPDIIRKKIHCGFRWYDQIESNITIFWWISNKVRLHFFRVPTVLSWFTSDLFFWVAVFIVAFYLKQFNVAWKASIILQTWFKMLKHILRTAYKYNFRWPILRKGVSEIAGVRTRIPNRFLDVLGRKTLIRARNLGRSRNCQICIPSVKSWSVKKDCLLRFLLDEGWAFNHAWSENRMTCVQLYFSCFKLFSKKRFPINVLNDCRKVSPF